MWPHPALLKGVAMRDYEHGLLGVMTISACILLYAEWSSLLDYNCIVDYAHALLYNGA